VKLPAPLRYVLGIAGLATASCNAFCAAFSVGDIAARTTGNPVGFNVGMALMFGGLALAGGLVAKRTLWPARARSARVERELKVLALVAAHQGRVTVADVAAGCQLGLADARAALDDMARHGVAEMVFTAEAVPVFVFPGLLSAEQKAAAAPLVLDAPAAPERRDPSDALADITARVRDAGPAGGTVPSPPQRRRTVETDQ
jgi:hypothetical protein